MEKAVNLAEVIKSKNKPCVKQGLAVIQFYEGVAANNMPNIVKLRYRSQGVE